MCQQEVKTIRVHRYLHLEHPWCNVHPSSPLIVDVDVKIKEEVTLVDCHEDVRPTSRTRPLALGMRHRSSSDQLRPCPQHRLCAADVDNRTAFACFCKCQCCYRGKSYTSDLKIPVRYMLVMNHHCPYSLLYFCLFRCLNLHRTLLAI